MSSGLNGISLRLLPWFEFIVNSSYDRACQNIIKWSGTQAATCGFPSREFGVSRLLWQTEDVAAHNRDSQKCMDYIVEL